MADIVESKFTIDQALQVMKSMAHSSKRPPSPNPVLWHMLMTDEKVQEIVAGYFLDSDLSEEKETGSRQGNTVCCAIELRAYDQTHGTKSLVPFKSLSHFELGGRMRQVMHNRGGIDFDRRHGRAIGISKKAKLKGVSMPEAQGGEAE